MTKLFVNALNECLINALNECLITDECRHSLLIKNRAVAINDESLLSPELLFETNHRIVFEKNKSFYFFLVSTHMVERICNMSSAEKATFQCKKCLAML